MENFKHLNEEKIGDVVRRLDEVETCLMGLVTLLRHLKNVTFDGDNLGAVGKLIEGQVEQLSNMSEILRHGHIRE